MSARIRSGDLQKEFAKPYLEKPPVFEFEKLGKEHDRILSETKSDERDRREFDRYNFKKWRLVIWLLTQFKVVPYTFYKKYCF